MNSEKVDFAGIQSEETKYSADRRFLTEVKIQFIVSPREGIAERDATKAFLDDIETFVGNYNK